MRVRLAVVVALVVAMIAVTIGPNDAPAGASNPPPAITGVVATPGDGTAAVVWTFYQGPGTTIVYTIVLGGETYQDVSFGIVFASGLTNGTTYNGSITVTVDGVTSAPTTFTVTPRAPTVPGVATDVTAVGGLRSAIVSWTAPVDDGGSYITSYLVSEVSGSRTCVVNTSQSSATSCTVGNIPASNWDTANPTSYRFRVKAMNAVGYSEWSAVTGYVYPYDVPQVITAIPGPTAAVAGDRAIAVSWQGFYARHSPITGYTATATPGGATCTSTSSLTCTVTGLTGGTSYTVTVTATNAAGTSGPTAATSAVVALGLPGKPTSLSGTAGPGRVTVSWSPPGSTGGTPITGYTVTSTPENKTCTVAPPATSCAVTGLTNGNSYTFHAKATNAIGTGPESDTWVTVVPVAPPTAPSTPTATAGNQSATVTWGLPSSSGGVPITGYTVTSSPSNKTCTSAASATSCTVTGLTNGTIYTFTVKASNSVGTGAASAPTNPVMPQAVQVDPCEIPQTGPFVDVSPSHPFCDSIAWFRDEGFTTGYSDGSFRPTGQLTRQSAAAFLYRFAKVDGYVAPTTPTFSDVPTTHAFYKEIEWMAAKGIAGGYPDGTFKPTGTLSRQSIAAFLFRLTLTNGEQDAYPAPAVAQFNDVAPSHPFAKAISWMVAEDYTQGYAGDLFKPTDPLTRQSVAVFLNRVADSSSYDRILARF